MGFPYGFKSGPELDSALVSRKLAQLHKETQHGQHPRRKKVRSPHLFLYRHLRQVLQHPMRSDGENSRHRLHLPAPGMQGPYRTLKRKRPPFRFAVRRPGKSESTCTCWIISETCEIVSRSRRTGRAAFPKLGTRNPIDRCDVNDGSLHIRSEGRWAWPSVQLARCSPETSPYLSPELLQPTFTLLVGSCDTPPTAPRPRPPRRTSCKYLSQSRRSLRSG